MQNQKIIFQLKTKLIYLFFKEYYKLDIGLYTEDFGLVELIDEFAPLTCHVMSLYEKTLLILS